MSQVTALGYFPFCVPEVAEDGNPFQTWDGSTLYSVDSQISFNVPNEAPSKTKDSLVTVYGPGSLYPIGPLTLEQAAYAFWKVKKWDVSIQYQVDPASGDDNSSSINGTCDYTITRGRVSPRKDSDDYNLIRFHYADEKDLVCYNDPFEGVQDESPYGYSDSGTAGGGDLLDQVTFSQGATNAEAGDSLHSSTLSNHTFPHLSPTPFISVLDEGDTYKYWMAAPIIYSASGVVAQSGYLGGWRSYMGVPMSGGELNAIGATPFSASSYTAFTGYGSFGAHFGSIPATVTLGDGDPISTSFWGMGYGNAKFFGNPTDNPDSVGITVSVEISSSDEFEYSDSYGGSDTSWTGWPYGGGG